MEELSTRLTRKGQITVPAAIRRRLGLKQGDKVAFLVEEDAIRFQRAGSVVERTAGALKNDEPPLSAEALRQVAEEAIAADVVRRVED